jgi:hypothetical protein
MFGFIIGSIGGDTMEREKLITQIEAALKRMDLTELMWILRITQKIRPGN